MLIIRDEHEPLIWQFVPVHLSTKQVFSALSPQADKRTGSSCPCVNLLLYTKMMSYVQAGYRIPGIVCPPPWKITLQTSVCWFIFHFLPIQYRSQHAARGILGVVVQKHKSTHFCVKHWNNIIIHEKLHNCSYKLFFFVRLKMVLWHREPILLLMNLIQMLMNQCG